MIEMAQVSEIGERIRRRLDSLDLRILQAHDPCTVADALLKMTPTGNYHALPAAATDAERRLLESWGEAACEGFNRLVALDIARQRATAYGTRVPQPVAAVYEQELTRILAWADEPERPGFRLSNDVFLKDLKCLTMEMVPCGAQVVEFECGIPRSTFWAGGLRQAFRLARVTMGAGGLSPWLQIHTHTPTLSEFHEQGWDDCYRRVASLLAEDDGIRGMFGASWFYDPEISKISPRLGYLRERPVERGASLFRIGRTEGALRDALATSQTRRDLHAAGQYMPTAFMLVWPRGPLIEWAGKAG